MFCGKCGVELDAVGNACPMCGADLSEQQKVFQGETTATSASTSRPAPTSTPAAIPTPAAAPHKVKKGAPKMVLQGPLGVIIAEPIAKQWKSLCVLVALTGAIFGVCFLGDQLDPSGSAIGFLIALLPVFISIVFYAAVKRGISFQVRTASVLVVVVSAAILFRVTEDADVPWMTFSFLYLGVPGFYGHWFWGLTGKMLCVSYLLHGHHTPIQNIYRTDVSWWNPPPGKANLFVFLNILSWIAPFLGALLGGGACELFGLAPMAQEISFIAGYFATLFGILLWLVAVCPAPKPWKSIVAWIWLSPIPLSIIVVVLWFPYLSILAAIVVGVSIRVWMMKTKKSASINTPES